MKKILLPLLVVIVGVGLFKTYSMNSDVSERYNLSELQSIASSANQNLPAKVDEVTILKRVTASEKILEKHYQMISIRKSDLDIQAFSKQMEKILIDQSCKNNQSINLFSSGVSEWFTYNDKNDKHILTIKVSAKNC